MEQHTNESRNDTLYPRSLPSPPSSFPPPESPFEKKQYQKCNNRRFNQGDGHFFVTKDPFIHPRKDRNREQEGGKGGDEVHTDILQLFFTSSKKHVQKSRKNILASFSKTMEQHINGHKFFIVDRAARKPMEGWDKICTQY